MAKKKKKSISKLKVTLVKSFTRRTRQHKSCIGGLGLRRIGHCVLVDDTPENRGMINKVNYLLAVDEEV